jgi:hypothetical protein
MGADAQKGGGLCVRGAAGRGRIAPIPTRSHPPPDLFFVHPGPEVGHHDLLRLLQGRPRQRAARRTRFGRRRRGVAMGAIGLVQDRGAQEGLQETARRLRGGMEEVGGMERRIPGTAAARETNKRDRIMQTP